MMKGYKLLPIAASISTFLTFAAGYVLACWLISLFSKSTFAESVTAPSALVVTSFFAVAVSIQMYFRVKKRLPANDAKR
jgi:cytochrome b subunit of formate dehydrogenase